MLHFLLAPIEFFFTALLVFPFIFVCPIICAVIAKRKSRRFWLWGIIGFFFQLFVIPVILLLRDPVDRLDAYLTKHPHCRTKNGIACAHCGSRSIRIWIVGAQQRHLCNHCGAHLYNS